MFGAETARTADRGPAQDRLWGRHGQWALTAPASRGASGELAAQGRSGRPADVNASRPTLSWAEADRQKSVKDPLGKVTSSGYDADGNRTSQTSPLGFVTSWTFDSDGRIQTEVDPRGNATGAAPAKYTTTYDYDPAGNQTTVTDPLGKKTVTAYDAMNHITSMTDPLGRPN
ncbi:hypothetical protein ACIBAH_32370 [Streptomyces sp. NPDC051445]|uniref:hypothetical protein n=1 Tax=Streptomyces sp. NPDC051445 TaxID=3365653 RepID=UPI00379B8249